ncbi:response regulator transcription factor [Neorhizobium galegae]|uniref:response regulator transcription factor n=1 Tax=Neorhizobium galegae TaxID=399 RepID=UPI002104B75F|nr:response regulator transcription factor [Neorhizobium galegae]MCQ1775822.1 response regulator transcription factor [Neorhizobium galegae]MCQ1798003.1 response regulator transcription factor [Neorhizobium galegae]
MNPKKSAPTEVPVPTVHVVEDDEGFRESLTDLFRSVSISVASYSNSTDFLKSSRSLDLGCVLLDVRLPGINGLDFQTELAKAGVRLPIIFMTGYGDIPMTVRAMKAGALDFLTKPFRDQDVLDAVNAAFQLSASRKNHWDAVTALKARYKTLTEREREVMHEVVKGLMNKQIAFNLGISEITVKIHRGNVMRKMEAKSVTDLVKQAELLAADLHHTDV